MTPESSTAPLVPLQEISAPEVVRPAKPNTSRYSKLKGFGRLLVSSAERRKNRAAERYNDKLERVKKLTRRKNYLAMLRRQKKLRKEHVQGGIDLADEQAQVYGTERK